MRKNGWMGEMSGFRNAIPPNIYCIFEVASSGLYLRLDSIFFCLLLHYAMQGSPTYIINVLLVTLLPGSVGLGLYLPVSPEPNSGCRSCFDRAGSLQSGYPLY